MATTDNHYAAAATCYRQYIAADTSEHAAIAIATLAAANAMVRAAHFGAMDAAAAKIALDATATSPVTGTAAANAIRLFQSANPDLT